MTVGYGLHISEGEMFTDAAFSGSFVLDGTSLCFDVPGQLALIGKRIFDGEWSYACRNNTHYDPWCSMSSAAATTAAMSSRATVISHIERDVVITAAYSGDSVLFVDCSVVAAWGDRRRVAG